MDIAKLIKPGELPCLRIKEIFYPDTKWDSNLAEEIGHKLLLLKKKMRIFYPHLSEIERMEMLQHYRDEDYIDACAELLTKPL